MAERAEFLRGIRSRLQEYQPTRNPEVPWTPGATRSHQREARSDDLPALFLEELHAVGGHGERVDGLEAAREAILRLVHQRGARRLVRWSGGVLEELDLDGRLESEGVAVCCWEESQELREEVARADLGLTGAAYAVAETGSLVICSAPSQGRTVTLLPPTYIAVAPVERVVRSVSDIIRRFAEDLPASLCFITGPSRSGDIEQSQTIGVHGPGDLHVILIG